MADIDMVIIPSLSLLLPHLLQVCDFALLAPTAANSIPKIHSVQILKRNYTFASLRREKHYLETLLQPHGFGHLLLPRVEPFASPGGNSATVLPSLSCFLFSFLFVFVAGIWSNHNSLRGCRLLYLNLLLCFATRCWQLFQVTESLEVPLPINCGAIALAIKFFFMLSKAVSWSAEEYARHGLSVTFLDQCIPTGCIFSRKGHVAV